MKTNKEYIKEDIYTNIQSLLEKTALDKLLAESSDKEQTLSSIEALEVFDEPSPGKFNIYMDAMKMHLYLDMSAPVNMKNDISLEKIKDSISEYGDVCCNQIDWELIKEVYNRVFYEGEILGPTVIASGIPVEYHIPEYIKLNKVLEIDLTPKVSESGSVDFHDINSFIRVSKGELIGHIVPDYPGIPGMNLMGKKITQPTKVISPLSKSINTVIKGDRVFSAIDGCIKTINDTILIDNCLDINSDVDYKTGDIKFDGDIHVVNSVREGFSLYSKEDIFIDEDLEPTDVICGDNLYVNQGIWGDPKYKIKCGGILTSKHINNAIIQSKGTVFAEKSIVKSQISTLDKIVLDKRGSIIGGEYHCLNGLKTGDIGNIAGITTNIFLGIDFEVKEKLEILQRSIEEISTEMNNLQRCLNNALCRKEREKIRSLFISLKNRLISFTNYSGKLLTKLDRNENSSLAVHGKIYPGTYIDICHVSMRVDRTYENVIFSLDKERGRIKWEYLF